MKPMIALLASTVFCGALTYAQAPAPSETTDTGQTQASLAANMTINAELDSSIDTKKVKQGDPVKAHVTER